MSTSTSLLRGNSVHCIKCLLEKHIKKLLSHIQSLKCALCKTHIKGLTFYIPHKNRACPIECPSTEPRKRNSFSTMNNNYR